MTTWHCKHCNFTTRTWSNMAKHSRKKHPNLMKRHKSRKEPRVSVKGEKAQYCPNCGKRL